MFFSANTHHPIREEIGTILNMSESPDPGKYLGLPTVWGRSKTEALAYVKSRIQQKIQSWKINSLSQAGNWTLSSQTFGRVKKRMKVRSIGGAGKPFAFQKQLVALVLEAFQISIRLCLQNSFGVLPRNRNLFGLKF
ncbi:hypothetical protein EV2_005755 [Malus domestica]